MGASTSSPLKQNLPHFQDLLFIKKTNLGKHYRDRVTNQQYLMIQIVATAGEESSLPYSSLSQHIEERMAKSKKHLAKIVSFKKDNIHFCNSTCRYQLWMLHPGRSLEEEIGERQLMDEYFAEEEIWMIIYSSLCAMISYHSLGHSVELIGQNIFISETGDVIISDASIYNSFHRLRGWKTKIQPEPNILNLHQLIQKIILLGERQKFKYSTQLHELLDFMKTNAWQGYQKLIALTISYKSNRDRDQAKKNQPFHSKIEYVVTETAEHYKPTPNIIPITPEEKPLQVNNKQNEMKHKFYRTAPNLLSPNPQNFSLNSTTPELKCEKYWSEIDFSNITDRMQTYQSDENPSIGVNSVSEQLLQNIARELNLKNKAYLQNLLRCEKNIILEVSENSFELSSAKSKMSQSLDPSLQSFHVTQSQSFGTQ